MINLRKTTLLLALSPLFILSCADKDSSKINNPATYEFSRDGVSTVDFSGQTIRIGMATELVNSLLDFDQTKVNLLEMFANQTVFGEDTDPFTNADYNASTKSIKSKVAASIDLFSTQSLNSALIKGDIESWIVNQVDEVHINQLQLATAGEAGQIADGTTVRYVNAQGLEYNQAVNKSLIGALIVDQICNNYLSTAVLDAGNNISDNDANTTVEGESYTDMEHKWDEAYGYLFGMTANTEDPLQSLGDDSFLNKYLSRVEDDTDFAGIASSIFEAFKLGRAAIVAGEYEVRDQQVVILKEKIAEIIAIRAVYYLQNGKNDLANNDFGGAFHDLSEGFGFVYSLRFLSESNNSNTIFTMSEVDGFINQLTAGNGFWDIDGTTLDQMSEAIAIKFDFTVVEAAE